MIKCYIIFSQAPAKAIACLLYTSRRIKNPYSTVDNDTIGQMYTFALKDGFVVDGRPGFVPVSYTHLMLPFMINW